MSDSVFRLPLRSLSILFVTQSAPGAATLRIGDEEIEIKTVSSNDIVLKYKMLYYEILYTIKELEARIEKIRAEEPSQENAIALRVSIGHGW